MLLESCLAALGQLTLAGVEFAGVLTLTVLTWAAVLKLRQVASAPAPVPVPLSHSGSQRLPQV